MIFVDGVDIGDPADVALRDRRMLSADGIFIVVATSPSRPASRSSPPEVIFRGVPFIEQADGLVAGHPRRGRALAGPRRRATGSARSTCSSRSCTTTSRRSSTTGCGAGRWCCRSSSRSDRPPARRAGAAGSRRRPGSGSRTGCRCRRLGRLERDRAAVRLGHRAHDRQAQARAAAAVAAAADEALEHPLLRARAGSRDRRPRRSATASPSVGARARRGSACPGGVWRTAFSSRLSTSRCRSSRTPGDDRRLGVDRQLVVARPSARARRRPRPAPRPGRSARCGCDALGVGAGQQQQVADQPAHPPRRAQRRLGGLGLLAARAPRPAARGWPARWSAACAARGRRRRRTRAGGRASPRSPLRAASSAPSIPSSVRASSATSSSASGWGICRLGSRVRSISRAASVSSTIGRIARAAMASPASSASDRAAEHAEQQEDRTRASVWSTSDSGRA